MPDSRNSRAEEDETECIFTWHEVFTIARYLDLDARKVFAVGHFAWMKEREHAE